MRCARRARGDGAGGLQQGHPADVGLQQGHPADVGLQQGHPAAIHPAPGTPPMSDAARGVRLGVLALAMINVAAIVSARNLPVMAEYGWSMLILFAISALVFLVPIS